MLSVNQLTGFGAGYDTTGENGPDFNNVSLLLHGDGTNGGNTFTDSSLNNFTMTRDGAVITSTNESKFGGASIYFSTVYQDLHTPANSDFYFGTGDFTVECWVRVNSYNQIFELGSYSDGLLITTNSSTVGHTRIYLNGAVYYATGSAGNNIWSHYALVRLDGVLSLYLDGISIWSISYASAIPASNTAPVVYIGASRAVNQSMIGYIDDFRIVKGEAVYTSNFTPPTSSLPNS